MVMVPFLAGKYHNTGHI